MQSKLLSRAAGATVPHLNMADIRKLEMPQLPIRDIQDKIGSMLSAYDDLIENNLKRIKLLEESAQLLYRQWFVDFKFPGYEKTKFSKGIPEGWEKVPLQKVIEVNPKTSAPKGEVRPFVPMTSLSETSMIIENIEQREVGGGAKFKNNDTLLARITPCLENGKTGFVQFMPDDDMVASGSTEFIVLRSNIVPSPWIYCLAREHNFRHHAIKSMSGSDGRQRVKPQAIQDYPLLKPAPRILQDFGNRTMPRFKMIERLCVQNRKLKEARDILLPRLMNGSIEV